MKVWQLAMDLAVDAGRLARRLPNTEKYELASQIRRAGVSIPANIAEGYGRRHTGDYLRHLYIANGSLKELETELLLAMRLGYLDDTATKGALSRADVLGRMLAALSRKLAASKDLRPKTLRRFR